MWFEWAGLLTYLIGYVIQFRRVFRKCINVSTYARYNPRQEAFKDASFIAIIWPLILLGFALTYGIKSDKDRKDELIKKEKILKQKEKILEQKEKNLQEIINELNSDYPAHGTFGFHDRGM